MSRDRADNRSPAVAAADWLVRLQADDAAEADWLAFETWLTASPENWAAYHKLERLSDEIDVRAGEVSAALRASAPPRAQLRTHWVRWSMVGMAVMAAGLLVWIALPDAVVPQVYDAGRGQVREIALADGTRVTLNAASHLAVTFERNARRVTMSDGEAAFDVAKDARRPFLIAVGDRTVKVVGTEFNVANRDRQLTITVARGVVEVSPANGATGEAVRLVRGRRLVHQIGSPVQRTDVVAAPEDAFSWRKLRLIYDNASLEEVVSDLNRYFPRQLVLDPEAKRLKFSGVLVVVDEDAVLRRLEELLPVAAKPSGDTVVLRHREGPS